MTKSELRRKYKLKRQALSSEELESKSLEIANQLLKIPVWDREFYHVFLSITAHKEVNTDYILSILSGKDKHIVVSKSDFETHNMTHFLLSDNTTIKLNAWQIPEPLNGIPITSQQIDVVILPLLAFDTQGHRVGYGKGFYDRFISECKPGTLKIGISVFEAEEKISGILETDAPMDYCVTPQRIYKF